MSEMTLLITRILALGAIGGGFAALGLLSWLMVSVRASAFSRALHRFAIPLAWKIATIGMMGSLYYSEVAGFTPCTLCWYQRIAMYPEVILLGLMAVRRNLDGFSAALTLAGIGFVIAAYQTLLQFGAVPEIPCSAVESAVSCSKRYIVEFGFVTIPLMTAVGFALIGSLLIAKRRANLLASVPGL